MNIKAWCPKCDWTGIAVVGRRFGLSIEDYKCPRCGNIVKRPYKGTYTWGAEKAHLIEEEEAKENICPHKKTIAINEEGHAGVYCVDCGEKLEDGC